MAVVESYAIMFYGGPDGYETNRARIRLADARGRTLAWIDFKDPGMPFERDYMEDGIIRMYLPSTSLQNVLDVLRNEKPVYIFFLHDIGFLSTTNEPVGEAEYERDE